MVCALPVVSAPASQRNGASLSSKKASLLSKVEQAFAAQSPADALISFATQLSGTCHPRNPEAASKWRAACRGITPATHSNTSQHPIVSSIGSSPSRSARTPGSNKQKSIERCPLSCFTPEPCWTPQPGSRMYSRLRQGLRKARYYASRAPSVRAYSWDPEHKEQIDEVQEETAIEANTEQPLEKLPQLANLPPQDASQRPLNKKVTEEFNQSEWQCPEDEEPAEISIPWTEAELLNVFSKFSDDQEHEIQTEDLHAVLRYLGARPTADEVQVLIREQTNYASLDWFEFLEFIRRYRKHDMKHLRELFESADANGSGSIDVDELHTLMNDMGYSPTKEATQEALDTIDTDNDGFISFSEFEQLREYLRISRGFLQREAEELRMLFRRVSRVQGLPVDELCRVSAYIGYHVSREEIRKITIQVDRDYSGTISFDELLEVIRVVREQEGEKLLKIIMMNETANVFNRNGSRGSGRRSSRRPSKAAGIRSALRRSMPRHSIHETLLEAQPGEKPHGASLLVPDRKATIAIPKSLPIDDIQAVLHGLDYFASPEIIEEILSEHLKDHEHPNRLTWEELKLFLRCYRRSEGFTKNELEFLRLCFDREQMASAVSDNEESLDALELGRVLRNFGISKTLQEVQRFIEEIDFDGSGQVEFGEFTKLMRQIFHEEAKSRYDIFGSMDIAKDGWMPIESLEKAVTIVSGGEPDEEMVRLAKQNSGFDNRQEISASEFERFFASYRKLLIESVREHAGFVPSEVEMLREIFDEYDETGDGMLQPVEMRSLVLALIPEASESAEGKHKFLQILEELTPQSNSDLDFSIFLRLMRKCHDQRDELDIVREVEVVKHCEYSPEEVEGLRQVFSSNMNCFGEITLEGMAKIFQQVMTVSEREIEELALHLKEVNHRHQDSLRFPDFLMLMRIIIQQNVLGINDAASRVLRRQEHRKTVCKRQLLRLSVVEQRSTEHRRSAHNDARQQADKRQPTQLLVPSDIPSQPTCLIVPA